jgi:hypothetical protein
MILPNSRPMQIPLPDMRRRERLQAIASCEPSASSLLHFSQAFPNIAGDHGGPKANEKLPNENYPMKSYP